MIFLEQRKRSLISAMVAPGLKRPCPREGIEFSNRSSRVFILDSLVHTRISMLVKFLFKFSTSVINLSTLVERDVRESPLSVRIIFLHNIGKNNCELIQ